MQTKATCESTATSGTSTKSTTTTIIPHSNSCSSDTNQIPYARWYYPISEIIKCVHLVIIYGIVRVHVRCPDYVIDVSMPSTPGNQLITIIYLFGYYAVEYNGYWWRGCIISMNVFYYNKTRKCIPYNTL